MTGVWLNGAKPVTPLFAVHTESCVFAASAPLVWCVCISTTGWRWVSVYHTRSTGLEAATSTQKPWSEAWRLSGVLSSLWCVRMTSVGSGDLSLVIWCPRPYHTLLLLESEKTLLSQLPLDCSPAMVRLIKTCSAVKNLQQLAQDADLALLQVHNRRPVSNAAAPDLNIWTRKALRVQPSRLFALIWDIIVSRASLAHCHNFIERQLS